MRKLLLTLAFMIFLVPAAFGWGQIGHRAVGHIAQQHLTPEAQARLAEILEGHSLAAVSTWMDEIRSDDAYDYTSTWHWVTIPDGTTYAETEKNPDGDALGKIKEFIAALEEGTLSADEERDAVRFLVHLVHLVGDIHQPLHVGTGDDRGGNDFTVVWFGEPSNLHRVWDSGMIDRKQLSFTELARFAMAPATDAQIADWQRSTPETWAQESMTYRDQLYDVPQDREIGYGYTYRNFDAVQQRLLQAGVRLAAVFNEAYS